MPNKRANPIWFIPRAKLQETIENSATFSEALRDLGFASPANVMRQLKLRLVEEGIDFSHIPAYGEPHGRSPARKISLADALVEGSTYNRGHLKKRLLDGALLPNWCAICSQLSTWNDKPLVLVLDHINGIHNDNRLHNLRLVCPNCDSQLSTFAG